MLRNSFGIAEITPRISLTISSEITSKISPGTLEGIPPADPLAISPKISAKNSQETAPKIPQLQQLQVLCQEFLLLSGNPGISPAINSVISPKMFPRIQSRILPEILFNDSFRKWGSFNNNCWNSLSDSS